MLLKTIVRSVVFFSCLLVFISSCKKSTVSSNNQNKKISVFLTDDPSQYDSVLVDIRYVEVKVDSSEDHKGDDHFGDGDRDEDNDHRDHDQFGKWDTLAIHPGVYNLMALRNGVNVLLASGNINGKIRKIRITLGTNNSVYKAGVRSPLNLYPGSNNYVYAKIHDEDEDVDDNNGSLNSNVWLDFDLSRSIIEQNGQFFLKPILRPYSMRHFGGIEGKVFPLAAHAHVSAFNSQDVANTIPEDDGRYELEGLHAGTYTVKFQGSNGYHDTTINNVMVVQGLKIQLPNITLSH